MPSTVLHPLVRVRTVTAFITLGPDHSQWQQVLAQAKHQCDRLADALEQKAGYAVQSIRLVSNPFGEYLDTRSADNAQQGLERITALLTALNTGARRIRFAIGEARSSAEVALLPALIASYGDLCNACVNVELDANGYLQDELLQASVQAVQQIALCTPRGEGNFNFTVNFNCASGIPYFPAGYHRGDLDNCLVLGLETPDLLVNVLQALQPERQSLPHPAWMARAAQALGDALNTHTQRISNCVAAAGCGLARHRHGYLSRTLQVLRLHGAGLSATGRAVFRRLRHGGSLRPADARVQVRAAHAPDRLQRPDAGCHRRFRSGSSHARRPVRS